MQPLSDPVAEGRRLHSFILDHQLGVRLLGGVGVVLHAHGPIPAPLQRSYKDLDFAVSRRSAIAWRELLESQGYEADTRFNTLHGRQRLLHYDWVNGRQVDTFVGAFEMCHTIDLDRRVDVPGPSLAPVDLLLTKLQIVEVNDKDLIDTLVLLADHLVAPNDPEAVDPQRLTALAGDNWGWYTTLSDNLEKLQARLATLPLGEDLVVRLSERILTVRSAVDSAPRSLRWRARAAIGRRMPWYDLPEEVGRDL